LARAAKSSTLRSHLGADQVLLGVDEQVFTAAQLISIPPIAWQNGQSAASSSGDSLLSRRHGGGSPDAPLAVKAFHPEERHELAY